jgi:IstB-like ATP binding protein
MAERIDALLNDAAREAPTYLDFLDAVLRQEVDAKQRTRTTMGLKIAHFPTVKTLDAFDFKFQPSVDQRLIRELAAGHFMAHAENVLIFGPPGRALPFGDDVEALGHVWPPRRRLPAAQRSGSRAMRGGTSSITNTSRRTVEIGLEECGPASGAEGRT